MNSHKNLREEILSELKKMILDMLEDEEVRVILFGSWARNEEKHSSDIDVAVESFRFIPPLKWIELLDKVEESTIPYHVDIVNLDNASFELVQNVKKEGIIWRDYNNE